MLQPFFAFEEDEHTDEDDDHHAPNHKVPPRPLKFGHVGEIHPVDSSDKRQRNEDGGDDGQHFHDFVHAIADAGKVNIQHPGDHIAEAFYRINNLYCMVIDIPQIYVCGFIDERRFTLL